MVETMNIEQKARAYDEAFERARKIHKYSSDLAEIKRMENIFPELKESKDEEVRKELLNHCIKAANKETIIVSTDDYYRWSKWLEKQGQKSAEWHREDEQNLNACLGYIPDEFLRRWLTDIIYAKCDKSAWSEEDEGFLNLLLAIFKVEHPNGIFSTGNITVFNGDRVTSNRIIDWIKDLKDRVQAQPHWKPSQEQMEALKTSFVYWSGTTKEVPCAESLESLYEQLKQL